MTKLEQILANVPSMPAFGDKAIWIMRDMLKALQGNVLGMPSDLDDELLQMLGERYACRLQLQTLVDLWHGSEEHCRICVLTDRRQPVLLMKWMGDCLDYSDGLEVLSEWFAKEMLTLIVDFHTRKAFSGLDGMKPRPVHEMLWGGVSYLCALSEAHFSVNSPRSCGFGSLFERHAAHLLVDGKMVQVTQLVRWVNPTKHGSDANVAMFETAQGEVRADATQVVFSLVDDPQALQRIACELSRPDWWQAGAYKSLHRDTHGVSVIQCRQGSIGATHILVMFSNESDARRFAEEFSEMHEGDFMADMDKQMSQRPGVVDWESSRRCYA